MPNGMEKIFDGYNKVVIVEMNDQGMYGYGQLATLPWSQDLGGVCHLRNHLWVNE